MKKVTEVLVDNQYLYRIGERLHKEGIGHIYYYSKSPTNQYINRIEVYTRQYQLICFLENVSAKVTIKD